MQPPVHVLHPWSRAGKVRGRGGRGGASAHCQCSHHPQKRNDFSAALPYIPLNVNVIVQAPAPSPEPPEYLGKESVDTADPPPNTATTAVDPGDRLRTAGAGPWPRSIWGNNLTFPDVN